MFGKKYTVQKNIDKEKALSKAAKMCSEAEHCVKDVTDKLTEWGLDFRDIDSVINYLVQNRYIDERRYTKAYVSDKIRFAGWGRIKIAYSLRTKNIEQRLIDESLESIDNEEYEEMITTVLMSKAKTLKANSSYEFGNKLYKYGVGRGFESPFLGRVVKKVLSVSFTDNNDDEWEFED